MRLLQQFTLKKQFYLIVNILLVICIILGVLVDYTVQNLLLENQKSYTKNIVSKFEDEVNYLFQRITTLHEYLQLEENIENIFIYPFSENAIYYMNKIQHKLLPLSILNKDIADIALVNKDVAWSNLFNAKSLKDLASEIKNTSTLSSLGIMPSSFIGAGSNQYLVFGKNIFGFKNIDYYGTTLGSIIISIDPKKYAVPLPISEEINTYFILADKNLNLYPLNCELDLANDLITPILATYDHTSIALPPEPIQLDTPHYLIYISYIPALEYYLVSAVDKQQFYSDLFNTRCLIVLIICIVIVFMLLLMRILLSSMINPLNQLHLFIKSIRQGNMKQLKHSITLQGSTEIVTLSHEFNRMLTEINTLNHQLFDTTTRLYEIELEKNKAEIAHLRSQINPHFLYNTLESIRGIALENNVPQIATLSVAMGKMFRYSIKGFPTAPLSEELSIVKAYLDIQLIRFNHKFDVFYHISPHTAHLPIPKMILQPLIENAIIHGLEKKLDTGTLCIGSKFSANNQLHILVQDDGIGMAPDILEPLLAALSHPHTSNALTHSHLGILNVHNRIHLTYGSPYGLQIESSENLGTKITLILPNLSKEKRDVHV